MTTITTNNEFTLLPSWTTSFLQSFKPSRLFPSEPPTLLEELNNQNPLTNETLQKVVAYLADHSNAGLEQALKEKLAKTDPSDTLSMVKSISMLSLQQDRLKMLEVCKRIVSLDQLKTGLKIDDPMAIAKRESSIIPLFTVKKISDTAIQNWLKYSSIFGKVIHWTKAMIMAFVVALIATLSSPLNNFFTNFTAIQGYLKTCRSMIDGFNHLITSYLELFATKQTAALAGVAILISAIAINYIHQRFRFGIPEKIDKEELFKNTTIEAQNGQIKEMKGRQAEREQVKTAWNVPHGEKFRIALIIGPPGSGKTEFVKGLAWESMNKPDSFIFGKKIFTLNTISLVRKGTNYLSEILTNIKGYEDDIVLFFDECHTAGALKGKTGPLIEALKTALLDNNIRAIFATTKPEYEENIAHNAPFVSRCIKIDFKELPGNESKQILKDKVELDVGLIEVDANAYDALLSVASHNPEGHNPRKIINLYNDVRDYVYSWEPKKLIQELDQLTVERDNLHAQCRTANNDDPNWSSSPDGIKLLTELKQKEHKILESTEKLTTQKSDMNRIARLRKFGPQYRKQYNEVVHQVVAEQSEELQKEFLYLKHVLRPALQDTLKSEAKKLTTTYQEELPLKIDAALIKKLYPAAFSSPENSSTSKTSSTEI